MSLDWNITDVKDQENVCWEHVPHSVLEEEAAKKLDDERRRKEATAKGEPITIDCRPLLPRRNRGDEVYEMNPVTNTLIFATMSIGLGGITEKNYLDFFARLAFMEKLDGAYMSLDGKPYHITIEMVRQHIGLRCNVCDEPLKRWLTRMAAFTYHAQFEKACRAEKSDARCPINPYR